MKNSDIAAADRQGDRLTKQFIIVTVGLIGLAFSTTVCILALTGREIPHPLEQLTILVLGNLSGFLVKTGLDAIHDAREQPSGTPGDPMTVTAPPNQAIPVEDVSQPAPDDPPTGDTDRSP